MITKKYYKLIRVSHADSGYFYIKNVSNEVGEFSFVKTSNPSLSNFDTEYSSDGVTWTSYDFQNTPTVSVNPNSNLYLRGTKFGGISEYYIFMSINFNKSYKIGGNILSLNNYNTMTTDTSAGAWRFNGLFHNQTNLVGSENNLFGNITTIDSNSFRGFFEGCTSLVEIPDFSNINTIGLSGFQSCFKGCNSLNSIPDFSNVTTVGNNSFYGTFQNCFSLTTGPDFSNVTSVGSNSFSTIFSNCFKLSTVTTPNIQDLTQNNVLGEWLNNAGTQATGTKTVRVPTGATIATDSASGIPTGWTRVDY